MTDDSHAVRSTRQPATTCGRRSLRPGRGIGKVMRLTNHYCAELPEQERRPPGRHVASLRRKLGDDAGGDRYVRTVRGVGYRMGTGC